MTFHIKHTNMNVMDIEKSVAFYKEALGLREVSRKTLAHSGDMLAFMTDDAGAYEIELTWLKDRTKPYDLSDNEVHIAFATPDLEAARAKHREMGCICYESQNMNLYFIEDPDGYWLEIVPEK